MRAANSQPSTGSARTRSHRPGTGMLRHRDLLRSAATFSRHFPPVAFRERRCDFRHIPTLFDFYPCEHREFAAKRRIREQIQNLPRELGRIVRELACCVIAIRFDQPPVCAPLPAGSSPLARQSCSPYPSTIRLLPCEHRELPAKCRICEQIQNLPFEPAASSANRHVVPSRSAPISPPVCAPLPPDSSPQAPS